MVGDKSQEGQRPRGVSVLLGLEDHRLLVYFFPMHDIRKGLILNFVKDYGDPTQEEILNFITPVTHKSKDREDVTTKDILYRFEKAKVLKKTGRGKKAQYRVGEEIDSVQYHQLPTDARYARPALNLSVRESNVLKGFWAVQNDRTGWVQRRPDGSSMIFSSKSDALTSARDIERKYHNLTLKLVEFVPTLTCSCGFQYTTKRKKGWKSVLKEIHEIHMESSVSTIK